MNVLNRMSKAKRNLTGKISRFMDTINNMGILRGDELEIPDVTLPQYWRQWLDEHQAWEKVAVLAGHRSYSFRALDQESDRIVATCRKKWQIPEESAEERVIVLHIAPSFERIAALLAILKMNCAYMPFEDALPPQRMAMMMGEVDVKYVITTAELAPMFASDDFKGLQAFQVVTYEEVKLAAEEPRSEEAVKPTSGDAETKAEEESKEKDADVNGTAPVSNNKLVAILYTSGSSGVSKGVKLHTTNVLNRLMWYWKTFPFGENEVGCHKTSLLFVDSLTEIFSCLLQGAPLVIVPRDKAKNPQELLKVINDSKVTRLVAVPSLLVAMYDICHMEHNYNMLQYLELIISSGEPLPISLAHRFFAHAPGACVLANFYGSTETTGDVTFKVFFSDSDVDFYQIDHSLCAGGPISNTNIYILNRDEEPLREGERGTVYVSGLNVTDGYIKSISDSHFIDNKFDNRPGHEFMYSTGDMGMIKDGKLFLFGRVDATLKIRGHRVNMSEIEVVIDRVQSIERRVILPCTLGDQTVPVCFCVLEKGSHTTIEDIIQILRGTLPAFMVPKVFIIDEFPLQPASGKIDQQALKEQFYAKHAKLASIKEADPAKNILGVISRHLGLTPGQVSSGETFMDLGGNSLSAVACMVDLKKMGYSITLEQFLKECDFQEFSEDLAFRKKAVKEPTIGAMLEHEKYEIAMISGLQDGDSKKAIDILSRGFTEKNPLDVLAGTTTQMFERLVASIWHDVLHDDLSFVVKDIAKDQILGVTIMVDANTHLNPEFEMEHVGAINDDVERPVKERLLKDGGHWADAMLTAVAMDTPDDEKLILIQVMEEETIRVAQRKGYDGIIANNSHPVTMAITEQYYGYKVENELPVKTWKFQGRAPFEKAKDDYVIKTMVKRLR